MNGQLMKLSQVFGLITQKDSKNSATIATRQTFIAEMAAQDSRVMRIIGIRSILFLPTTLVTVGKSLF